MLKQKGSQKTQKKIAYGYARVSTKEQMKDGISIETQHARIKGECEKRELKLEKIFTDAISGKDIESRPQLLEMLSTVEKGDCIVFTDLSRLSRSTKDALTILEDMAEKGIKLICLAQDIDFTTPSGELMFTVLCAMHKLERRNIGANISTNMKRISQEGKLRAQPPIGWRFVGKDKDYEPVETQQELIKEIIKRYRSGKRMNKIARELNEEGENIKLMDNKPETERNKNKIPKFYCETIKKNFNRSRYYRR